MGYIFFYENYDIYKTEQLCATLYKLMEMILIAKELKKTLVLPNFYFTPRNNELINKNNELEIDRIEYVDIQNILNINSLKEIVNYISLTEFFKIKNNNFVLINKEKTDIPFVNNKYFTIYGILNIDNIVELNYSSLSLLNYKDKICKYDNIIIHNYNRMGNPIWYKNIKEVYYNIRNHIKFNDYLMEKKIIINYEKTLMVHWRRGDFKLNIGDELETKLYYKNYTEKGSLENLSKNIILRCLENNLDNILLLTNETNENELIKLNNILLDFKITTTVLSASDDNNYLKYLINDIIGIINGSKCKFQLHGYGSYDRMSQYGKWIIE